MPKGPHGQKRPADVIGAAVKIAKIATGEIEEDLPLDEGKNKAAQELGRKGGQARAKALTKKKRDSDCKESGYCEMGKRQIGIVIQEVIFLVIFLLTFCIYLGMSLESKNFCRSENGDLRKMTGNYFLPLTMMCSTHALRKRGRIG